MTVRVTKTKGYTAEITWEKDDDPQGYLAVSVEGDQLACALTALGATRGLEVDDEEELALTIRHTKELAQLLDRRAAILVVKLRDEHGMSWPHISDRVLGDPDKHSSVRRMYDSGRKHLGR